MALDCMKQVTENPSMKEKRKKYHYCILYTNVLKQEKVRFVLKRALPEDRGTVFYPCMECYRRDTGGKLEIRPIFPGYIFIRTDMGNVELHEFIRNNHTQIMAFVRELKLSQRKAYGEDIFVNQDKNKDKELFSGRNTSGDEGVFSRNGTDIEDDLRYGTSDLTEEETDFIDFLLNADGKMGSSAVEEGKDNDMPIEGLLRMSYGYQEGNQYKVMKGPLRTYEDHITGVNKHDKKAYLDIKINGKVVRAGFDVMPKRYWFPNDKDTPEMLADGTEVDLQALAKAMMG